MEVLRYDDDDDRNIRLGRSVIEANGNDGALRVEAGGATGVGIRE